MRKLSLILYLCLLTAPVTGQSALTVGLKYGRMNPANINRTVYSYNYARQWLTTPMPYFGNMRGWEVTWQRRSDPIGWEFAIGRIQEINRASGPEPGGLMAYRRLRVGIGGFSFGANLKAYSTKHVEVVPVLDFDLHFMTAHTSYSNTADSDGGEETMFNVIKGGNTFAVNVSLFATRWIGINIRPYYAVTWGKANVEGMADYWASGQGAQRERVANYGISGALILGFRRKE